MPSNRFSINVNRVQLKNLQNKMKKLEKLAGGGKELQKALKHAGSQGVGRMKQDARVRTGRLRRNIEYDTKGRTLVITSEAIDPETNKDYAPLYRSEYFDNNVKWVIEKLFSELNRRINRIINRR